ncbi:MULTISPECIES: RCC1 domain-containing protein, partial [Enterobacterales]|uniref:RCC1 domain-containing protein n=1 Tax=Enterobacterales TaxID=91347 RepID=UPI0039E89C0A
PAGWTFGTPVRQADGSWSVTLSEGAVSTGMDLYEEVSYQGTAQVLAEHDVATLRTPLGQWAAQSAKMNGLRLLSYTEYDPNDVSTDYRLYRDSYRVEDVPDLSVDYQAASLYIRGTALGENDVVVRVRLTPDDTTQRVVMSAFQRFPQLSGYATASLTVNGVAEEGVLVVFDKTQPVTTVAVQAGVLNEDGTADWQVSTTVRAVWSESRQEPLLTLDDNAPADWQFLSMQATGNAGEFTTLLTGDLLAPGIVVRGARNIKADWTCSPPLVALDKRTLQPVVAQWQYEGEGESEVVTASRFTDQRPEKKLTVWSSTSRQVLTLRPQNISVNWMKTDSASTALLNRGNVVAWGDSQDGGSVPPDIASRTDLSSVSGNVYAFVALSTGGSVVAWGDDNYGGSVPSAIASRTDLVSVAVTDTAFAALTNGGSVVAWGESSFGGSVPSDISSRTDLVELRGTGQAFAALTAGGSVVAWGESGFGGSVPSDISARTDLKSLFANFSAFAALTSGGSVVAWGYGDAGGSVPSAIASRTDLVSVAATLESFAALTSEGNVVAWGEGDSGGSVPSGIASRNDLVSLCGSENAFAALTAQGGVVAWGDEAYGSSVPPEIASRTDLVNIAATAGAFAALTASGDVLVWGDATNGGTIPSDVADMLTNVVAIYSGYMMFVALKSDDTVVVWGGGEAGEMANIPAELQGNISYLE